MFFAPLYLALASQSSEIVLDPAVSEVAVFKPGLVYVVREATVPTGLHQFRLKSVPQALDGTLWYDSPDGAKLSDLRTTIEMNASLGKKPVLSIEDLLAASVGKNVEIRVRSSVPNAPIETVKGKLIGIDQRQSAVLMLPNHHMRAIGLYEAVDVNTEGLPLTRERKRPRIELRFRSNASRASRVRFYSLEMGAAWVANYRLTLSGATGELESAAQLGLGSLSLQGSRVRLVTGVPNLDVKSRLDLASGASSLSGYLANRAGTLSQSASDPFEFAESLLRNGSMGGGGGMGGMAGGMGVVGDSIDFVSYDPSDNSLVVKQGSDAPEFLSHAIEASRLEDLHVYDFGNVTLPAGGRITRVLSMNQVPLDTIYTWNIAVGSGFERTLRMHNSTAAGWPAGTVLLQSDGIPLAQVPMLFTPAGQDAGLVLGTAEDILHKSLVEEKERHPIPDPHYPRLMEVQYEATIEATNTRNDRLQIEINFPVTGTIADPDGGTITKGVTQDPLNPSNTVTWRLQLKPGERKTWTVHFKTSIQ